MRLYSYRQSPKILQYFQHVKTNQHPTFNKQTMVGLQNTSVGFRPFCSPEIAIFYQSRGLFFVLDLWTVTLIPPLPPPMKQPLTVPPSFPDITCDRRHPPHHECNLNLWGGHPASSFPRSGHPDIHYMLIMSNDCQVLHGVASGGLGGVAKLRTNGT